MSTIEIERKFLVADTSILKGREGIQVTQGYLADSSACVRIRIAGDKGFLTLKGAPVGLARSEFEYEIPLSHAELMIASFCGTRIIDKTRYLVECPGHTFEVDVFHGKHEGLVIAEVELLNDEEFVELPVWVGEEVSTDPRFFNMNMAKA